MGMPNAEQLGHAFTLLCFFLAFLSLIRMVVYDQTLPTYLKAHHYDRWKEFIGEDTDIFRNIYLKPMNSDKSYFHFICWSHDDLGDTQVHDYWKHVRGGILGFLINVVAAVIGFVTIGMVLSGT
jgi:hypothetical protein